MPQQGFVCLVSPGFTHLARPGPQQSFTRPAQAAASLNSPRPGPGHGQASESLASEWPEPRPAFPRLARPRAAGLRSPRPALGRPALGHGKASIVWHFLRPPRLHSPRLRPGFIHSPCTALLGAIALPRPQPGLTCLRMESDIRFWPLGVGPRYLILSPFLARTLACAGIARDTLGLCQQVVLHIACLTRAAGRSNREKC